MAADSTAKMAADMLDPRPQLERDIIQQYHLDRLSTGVTTGSVAMQQDVHGYRRLFARWGYTLCQLEDVLLAVNDLQCATPHELCDVTSMEEPILIWHITMKSMTQAPPGVSDEHVKNIKHPQEICKRPQKHMLSTARHSVDTARVCG
jgi:hypothetical protein